MSPRTTKQYEQLRNDKIELIKNTALKLFAHNGYHATSISKIAKEAGISKGLMYNYFDSKEELIVSLLNDYVQILGALLNPNNDNEITYEEMNDFFHMLVKSLSEKNDYWKLFMQLSTQQDVISIMFAQIQNSSVFIDHYKLLYTYFLERFDDPEQEMLLFNSIIKGFCLIYMYTPETFNEDSLNEYIERLKLMFLRKKRNHDSRQKNSHSDIETGYSHR